MGGQLIDHSPHSKVAHKQSLKEENMKHINTRLRWLFAGVYLATAFFAWLEQDKETKKIRKMVDKWPQPFDSGIDHPPLYSDYKHNHNKEAY